MPIALSTVETGRWLTARGAGFLFDTAHDLDAMLARLAALSGDDHAAMKAAILAINRSDLVLSQDENIAILETLVGNATG